MYVIVAKRSMVESNTEGLSTTKFKSLEPEDMKLPPIAADLAEVGKFKNLYVLLLFTWANPTPETVIAMKNISKFFVMFD